MSQIRGLVNFIGDIRNCKTEEEERGRVDKELAKIRESFSNSNIKPYAKKKYMWKIMYMYTLGYTVEFGHMQCVDLIRSDSYSEKNVGYVAVSLLLIEHTDMLRLCINTIKHDLKSRNEIYQCLALTCVANVGGPEFAESLVPDVQALLVAQTSRNFVRKKAALCLLRLVRQYPDNVPSPSSAPEIIKYANHRNVGVVTSVLSLLIGLATYDSPNYESVVPLAIQLLHQFVINRECSKEYIYYRTPCPWLQVKLLKILQYYPPPKDKNILNKLNDILERIVTKTEVTQSVNKNHADHSILFEAMNVIIHLNLHGKDILQDQAIRKLLHFINVKEGNIRYLGLDAMARLAKISGTHKLIKRHLRTIQYSLDDNDISIRKRALDLLYGICDEDNVVEIIEHLLKYLAKAEYGIREEMVLKIAILAEKFATDLQWYINVVLQLMSIAGDFVSEDVWHRIVQIVTNNENLQQYAADKVFSSLNSPPVHESMIKVGGYILGEFGHLLEKDGEEQFGALHKHFQSASSDTKALLLSTYMKFCNMYEDLNDKIVDIFKLYDSAIDPEIQQRANEYKIMATYKDQDLITQVWEAMPDFPERESNLMKLVKKKEGNKIDKDPFSDNDEEKNDEDEEDEGDDEEDGSSSAENDDTEVNNAKSQNTSTIETTSSQPSKPPEDDLLGTLFGSDINADQSNNSSAISLEQPTSLLNKLLTSNTAVLYEDNMVQIGVKSQTEVPGAVMKIILFYGNRCNSTINVKNVDLKAKVNGLDITFDPPSLIVAPKQQAQQKCRAIMISPSDKNPEFIINLECDGKNYSISGIFPVVACKFFKPFIFEPQEFKERWTNLKHEEKRILSVTANQNADSIRDMLLSGMGMGLISNVDNNPSNSVTCSVFHFGKKKSDGNYVNMPVLMRCEYNGPKNAVRVTVRSPHPATTKAVVSCCELVFTN